MDLYKGLYTSPDAFLEDVSFIENNAEIEGDGETIIKAAQMSNHAKVMVDQTFDEAFKADCAKMAERAKNKKKSKEVARIEERNLKRARVVGEGTPDLEVDENGPSKRARGENGEELLDNINIIEATPSNGHIFDLPLSDVQASPSHSHPVNQSTGMASSSTASSVLSSAGVSVILSPNIESAVIPLNGTIIAPVTIVTVSTSSISASNPTSSTAIEIPSSTTASPMVVDEPIIEDLPPPEPLPDFILATTPLDTLKTFLRVGTEDLNVDQLEQLRAACYDAIWRGRKDWNRDSLVNELTLLAQEFVEEVQECNK